MTSQELKKLNLPDTPGVYFFKKQKEVLYIGKATSLKERAKSYFVKDLIETRSVAIADMVVLVDTIDYIQTDTALEALLLEAELIKKYKPKYNTKEKDNRSFNYVIITDETIPRVELIRGRTLKIEKELTLLKPRYTFGPFLNNGAIREGLRIVRRIFPYTDKRSLTKDNHEFYKQLGLTPDTTNKDALEKYSRNIQNIVSFFKGNKKQIIKSLESEMMLQAKILKFEEALFIKKQIFALNHINDIAVIKSDFFEENKNIENDFRIEGYDIAHMSGQNMVGVMTVVVNGQVDKAEYKKFNIKTQKQANDTGALHEVLMRRFKHTEWSLPDLVVVDGGLPQIRVAEQVLRFYQIKIPVVSVLKDESHKPKDILGSKEYALKNKKDILLVNSEAHRFSIDFHKDKRNKSFLNK